MTIGGIRDKWLRARWPKEKARLLLGGEDWPLHDFRDVIVGVPKQPRGNADDTIEFPLTDLSGALDVPLQTSVHTEGPNQGRTIPRGFGVIRWMDVSWKSEVGLEAYLGVGPVIHTGSRPVLLYDNGAPIWVANVVVTSVNIGTDKINKTAHGLLDDWAIYFSSTGTTPGGITAGQFLYVVNSTANDFCVALVKGGTPIDITSAGSGTITYTAFGYSIDQPTALITFVSPPAGRVTAFRVYFGDEIADANPARILSDIIFGSGALSENEKDQVSFDDVEAEFAAQCAGILAKTGENVKVSDLALAFVSGTLMFLDWAPDGVLTIRRIKYPTGDPAMRFVSSDIKDGSMVEKDAVLPIDFSRTPISYDAPAPEGGPIQAISGDISYFVGPSILPFYDYGGATVPLDDVPDLTGGRVESFDTLFSDATPTTEQQRLVDLFKAKLGLFEFSTRLFAIELGIGDVIEIDHPEFEFKNWTEEDPASPDNTGSVEGKRAVVVGVNPTLSTTDPFPVKLTVFKPMPGFFPQDNLS